MSKSRANQSESGLDRMATRSLHVTRYLGTALYQLHVVWGWSLPVYPGHFGTRRFVKGLGVKPIVISYIRTKRTKHQENDHWILRGSRKSRSSTHFRQTCRKIDALPSASVDQPVLRYASMEKGLTCKLFDASSLS